MSEDMCMERDEVLEKVFYSSTSKVLREEQLLNYFGVSSLDEIPTEKLMNFCDEHYCSKGGITNGCKV